MTTIRGGTWTYTHSATPSTRDKTRKRFGDVDSAEPLLSDNEIDAYLTARSDDIARASIDCCMMLSGLYARQASMSNGALSLQAETRARHFRDLADDIRKQPSLDAVLSAAPQFGGQLVSERDRQRDDASVIQPMFERGQDDHPAIAQTPNELRR